ncbi:AAA family ATPase [Lentilactobacillus hilgardii]|uniref:AAA family ATPase n=1 Tax=Lentilactobacillus hilgardii TaxID=1588 RepID=UPI00390CC412
MATSLYTLITQLISAHFQNDNASFESLVLAIIRVISADQSKLAQKNALKMAKLLKEHQAGMSASMYTRSVSREPAVIDESFYQVIEPKTSLKDLVLPAKIIDQVQSILLSRQNIQKLRSKQIPAIAKVIISGKPGTGKSSLASAIANALNVPLLVIKLPMLFSSYLGDSGRNILNTFQQIESQHAVILFDEFDSIATSRSDRNDIGEIRRVVNTLLTLLDNWQGQGLIIATTNSSEDLDEAIWRRFDLSMSMPLPHYAERMQLWQQYGQDQLTRSQLELVSHATHDWSPAEIKLLSQQAMREFILKRKPFFGSIVSQLPWENVDRVVRKKLLLLLHESNPELSTRELSEIVGVSKSTVQRDLNN